MVKTRGLKSAKVRVEKAKASTLSRRKRVEKSEEHPANAKAATVASGRMRRAYSSSEEEESPNLVISVQKRKPRISEAEEPKAKRSRKEPSRSIGGIMYKWHSKELFYGRINQNARLQYLNCIESTLTRTDWQTVLQGPEKLETVCTAMCCLGNWCNTPKLFVVRLFDSTSLSTI